MRPLLAILALVLLGAGGAAWWARHRHARAANGPAYLLVSGDTAGWITPCGCTANQSGGLLRRATYLASLRAGGADVTYVDCGGAPAGNSEYQRLKFGTILKGEAAMGLVAHNIGGPEAALGTAHLRELARRFPLISANARGADDQPLADALRLITAGNGTRLAVVGIVSPQFATAAVRIDDPKHAVLAALAGARGTYDRAVVLAYVPEDELARLAADLPEADAVIGGPTGQAIAPRPAGSGLLAAATNKGKFLVKVELPSASARRAPLTGEIAETGPWLVDDVAQQANLASYLAALGARDFTAAETGLAPFMPEGAPAAYRVAGTASCRTCHVAESAAWDHSHHAHAWETLRPRGFQVEPSCLQCHTTGYGLPGGFESVRRSAAALAGVGCENCHGPSQAHAADPKVRTPFNAADQCMRCHDHENSPRFEYAAYWPRVQHGNRGAATVPEVRK